MGRFESEAGHISEGEAVIPGTKMKVQNVSHMDVSGFRLHCFDYNMNYLFEDRRQVKNSINVVKMSLTGCNKGA